MKKLLIVLFVIAILICLRQRPYEKEVVHRGIERLNRTKQAQVKPKYDKLKLDAWCMAQRFVEQSLKCPRTVKWPWVSYSKVTTHLGNGRYRCASYFDAQNSFGAMIRTNFVCVVEHTGGSKWRLESLTF